MTSPQKAMTALDLITPDDLDMDTRDGSTDLAGILRVYRIHRDAEKAGKRCEAIQFTTGTICALLRTIKEACSEARAEAFAQAREMAAKEADLAPGTNGRFIAKKIRALECPKESK